MFIFQFFPFQFVFFLFNRNNLIRRIQVPELSWLSHFLLVKKVHASGKLKQGLLTFKEKKASLPGLTKELGEREQVGLGLQFWGQSGNLGILYLGGTLTSTVTKCFT